jgi:hypothetical protein
MSEGDTEESGIGLDGADADENESERADGFRDACR